jgi:hypothetical protein
MSDANTAELVNKIVKSENKLSNVMTKCGISPAGQSFIDSSLDLFKDAQGRPPCIGYPDMAARNIVVQKVRATNVISRPAGLAVGGTWDCHIVNKMCNNVIVLNNYTANNQNLFMRDAAASAKLYGGVMVFTGAAGTPLGLGVTTQCFGLDPSYFNGDTSCRVIGKAHEVVNTTATLNIQGNVIVYQKPTCPYEEALATISISDGADTTVYGSLTTFIDFDGLGTPAQLLNYPKSKSWPAKDGCYQTCVMNSTRNTPGTDRQIMVAYRDGIVAVPLLYATEVAYNIVNATTKSTSVPFTDWPFISPFNESGSYFQGLSYETTLQLTTIYLLESTPGRAQANLNTLTFLSPPFDPCALEMYSKLVEQLPAGVPVDQNGAGDWIQYIAEAADTMGVPGARLVAKGGKLVSAFEQFASSGYGIPTALTQSTNKNSTAMNNYIMKRKSNQSQNKPKNRRRKKNPPKQRTIVVSSPQARARRRRAPSRKIEIKT